MAKPVLENVVDERDRPLRRFNCNAENVLFIKGTDFDTNPTVQLHDQLGVAEWDDPTEVRVVQAGRKLKVRARCNCRQARSVSFLDLVLAPFLFLLRLSGIYVKRHGTGGLTVTVTNGTGGTSDLLTLSTIDYA